MSKTENKAVENIEEASNAEAVAEYNARPAIIKDFEIIKHLIVTEETQKLERENNTLVFAVDKKATKMEIKAAIQALFRAKVASVNTINVSGKKKRVGRYTGKTASYKKAFVKFDSAYDLGKITAAVASEDRQANED